MRPLMSLILGWMSLVAVAIAAPHAAAAPRGEFDWPLQPRPGVVRAFDKPEHDWLPGHRGVDLAADTGRPVLAAGDGIVAFAGTVAGKPVVSVDHAGGLRTTYEPVEASVPLGRKVTRGTPVGTLRAGHDGCPVSACLHWGLRRGHDYLDPLGLIHRAPLRLKPTTPRLSETTATAIPLSTGQRRDQDEAMSPQSTETPFTYPDVGATRGEFPPGYHHAHLRRRIGSGRDTFDRAADQILAYRMQKGTGVFQRADTPTAEPGTEVRMFFGLGRIGITAPARVVYVLDEPNRRGFAYGTLPGHPLRGEEQFAAEFDPTDDSVHVVVAAFSLPGTWYARLGAPVVRQVQRIFSARYIDSIEPT